MRCKNTDIRNWATSISAAGIFGLLTLLSGCGFNCIDAKTGIHRSSQTLKQSKENGVFQFQMQTNRKLLKIGSGRVLNIRSAWVENSWMYECINNKAVLKKDSSYQFVIDGVYKGKGVNDSLSYALWADKSNFGIVLGGQLTFGYAGQDTFILTLVNNDKLVIDTLKFWRSPVTHAIKKDQYGS